MLEVSGLDANYGAISALRQVTLQVPAASIVALVGANGAGKTTLLDAVAGGGKAITRGTISFNGKSIRGLPAREIVGSGIALVPEGRQLFGELTVDENLRMGAYSRRDRAGVANDYDAVRTLFPRLVERRRQLAATLSGGEQQMVALARALMSAPKLLLLDEPSLGLAPILVNEVMTLIRRINERGVAVLLVEQNVRQALAIASKAYVLERGVVTLSGPASDLARDARVFAAYLSDDEQA
ncbi:ABC transporter ATP-binding protein [Bradyrhizobium sp. AUGA SZCCT0182]|uniref:ABC transporter ATP-binding protein n=1 Tax=Bradyrhizobium sp. AUGA SZCCT0182 TaxID=2807667 RepID=UPI001BAE524B|nr:ABC transporter ATP-binding protein [Bradyrhizobium sp. AUGA SZCCT0182]MBR1231616.1 ABC transporter ATP-binding protein [Bradyrhizobium sp. AUGA SZCCT0182]